MKAMYFTTNMDRSIAHLMRTVCLHAVQMHERSNNFSFFTPDQLPPFHHSPLLFTSQVDKALLLPRLDVPENGCAEDVKGPTGSGSGSKWFEKWVQKQGSFHRATSQHPEQSGASFFYRNIALKVGWISAFRAVCFSIWWDVERLSLIFLFLVTFSPHCYYFYRLPVKRMSLIILCFNTPW